MVDKQRIMELLVQYFKTTGPVTVSDEGLVSCTGWVHLKTGRIHERLPVAFDRVTGSFVCSENQLKTLEGAPTSVGGDFICNYNRLTSLEHAPEHVGSSFICYYNRLTTLHYAPKSVGNNFNCYGNKLTTLEGLPAIPGTLYLSYSPTLPLLRCLLAKEVQFLPTRKDKTIETILNKYAGQGKRVMFDCQKELEDAGFSENARW